jgi:hypothetical protein
MNPSTSDVRDVDWRDRLAAAFSTPEGGAAGAR